MGDKTPCQEHAEFLEHVFKTVLNQFGRISSFRIVYSENEEVRIEVNYKTQKPWEGKEDYE